ncbi:hypothetical protein H310_04851 [Aphanomyces invadans]|uniref:Uncharacterized protein n=1 Tax=Aphanomyces invadans TaxID=157072 RepID=A0A024UAE4_9STRA|nr:hypothetical protein H310_04851 [Aphanomyces invadans]ETW03366.1 hypothetical protein H310_04851 [Aphanomyces invadans]|eukprot:XP_008867595.1 hypothetical protein H310_04851 [Aphanomyces invadans]
MIQASGMQSGILASSIHVGVALHGRHHHQQNDITSSHIHVRQLVPLGHVCRCRNSRTPRQDPATLAWPLRHNRTRTIQSSSSAHSARAYSDRHLTRWLLFCPIVSQQQLFRPDQVSHTRRFR